MRKSTLVALVLLTAMLFVFLWLATTGVKQHEHEIGLSRDLTQEFAGELVPGTRVRLKRERGSEKAIVSDPGLFVLLMNVEPSEKAWKRDAEGVTLARAIATRAHERYGPERPVQFVEVVLVRADGTKIRLGFREDRDGHLQKFDVPPLPR